MSVDDGVGNDEEDFPGDDDVDDDEDARRPK